MTVCAHRTHRSRFHGCTKSLAGHCSAAASSEIEDAPSSDSRTMSACPACRAVSSIRCKSTQRRDQASTSCGNHGTPLGTGTGWPRSSMSGNEFFRLVRRHGVVGEDLVETVVGREPETAHVLRRVRPRRAPHGVHPAALYLRQMLDDATY